MSDAFEYRPKFVDIRVRKSARAEKAAAPKPEERACDHIGCKLPGSCKAPKGRDHVNEFWHFCTDHAAEYNRRWNYFSGMSDAELADFQRQAEVGHRPTWTLRGGKGDRLSASMRNFQKGDKKDPFEVFGTPGAEPAVKQRRRLSKLQGAALEVLQLEENATAPQIRTRYAELVKRWHPDSNGGDRGAETNLQRVVQAYQQLKAGGLV